MPWGWPRRRVWSGSVCAPARGRPASDPALRSFCLSDCPSVCWTVSRSVVQSFSRSVDLRPLSYEHIGNALKRLIICSLLLLLVSLLWHIKLAIGIINAIGSGHSIIRYSSRNKSKSQILVWACVGMQRFAIFWHHKWRWLIMLIIVSGRVLCPCSHLAPSTLMNIQINCTLINHICHVLHTLSTQSARLGRSELILSMKNHLVGQLIS